MRDIASCTRCPLHETRTHVVVYRGGPRPSTVFIGEAPGAEEDRQGRPFVGRSGRLLDESIAGLGLTASEFGIVNLVKCRPPKNAFSPSAAATCRPFLDRQLELLGPELLVSLGAHALAALDPSAPRVGLSAGTERTSSGRRLFPLLHPAATFRSRRNLDRWRADLERLRPRLPRRANAF